MLVKKKKFELARVSNLILLPAKIVFIPQVSDKFSWSNTNELGAGNLTIISKLVSNEEETKSKIQ